VPATGAIPVVDTANGMLDLDGPQVEVRATAASREPVFIGIARADDVTAYLADVSRSEITRVAGDGKLTARRVGSAPAVSDPTGADIWVASRTGTGSVALTWPDTPGSWRVVIAGDGSSAAPGQISLTWARAHRANSAPAVITVGVLLLLAGGLAGLVELRGYRCGAGADGDTSPVDPDGLGPMADPAWASGRQPDTDVRYGDAATRIISAEETRSVPVTGESPAAPPGGGPGVCKAPEASETPEARQ
jgi:hypothetical protein